MEFLCQIPTGLQIFLCRQTIRCVGITANDNGIPCLILVGYDDQYYYFNDPYQSGGLKAYARSVVEARYAAMGSQAVVIERK